MQKVATEKDMFLQRFEHERKTTLKLLRAYPADKGDFKPHERSRSAKDLAWTFVLEQGIAGAALRGKIDFSQTMPPAPPRLADAIAGFEKAGQDTHAAVSKMSEEDLNHMVQFPVGPGKMGDFRKIDVLWMTLMDQVHHRGQLSVYVRMAGGKVPSIYGPSADEPWM